MILASSVDGTALKLPELLSVHTPSLQYACFVWATTEKIARTLVCAFAIISTYLKAALRFADN
jgi:hypothetical protein